jgi:predicted dehydrogenase
VTAVGGLYEYKGKITTPDTLTAHFEFDGLPVVWRHRLWGAAEFAPEVSNGVFFYGDKATVFATDSRWIVIPKERGAQRKVTDIKPAPDMGARHVKEWIEAVRAGRQPSCTVEEGYKSTTMVKLAMISYSTGRTIRWDAEKETIPNDPEAAKLLKRAYRTPWKHPYA